MLYLSVIIIAKNASNVLKDCLTSISWADEVILLDSGSNDDTVKIALEAGVKVFTNFEWQGYGIQRQRAQHFATGDYILMIDTDERVTSVLRQSIQYVLTNPQPKTVYSVSRRNYFLGRFMKHSGWFPDRVIRLYERKNYQYNNNQIHESLSCESARIINLKGDLLHFTCQNFISFQRKQLEYANHWAVEYYKKGKKISLIDIFGHTLGAFLKTLFLRGGLLDGKQGYLLAITNAQYTFNKYTELWAINHGYSETHIYE